MGAFIDRLRPVLAGLWRFGRAELGALAALCVAAGGLAAFMDLAEDMTEADARAFDLAVLEHLRPAASPHDPWGPPWLEHAMAELTSFGGVSSLALIVTVAVLYLLIQRRAGAALMLAVALGGGAALSQGLKALFGRERPPLEYRAMDVANASFPSGHAMLSTVVYLTVGAMLAQAMPKKRLRVFVFAVAIFLALVVGASRVFLGVHWLSDVLAGWSLGAAWAMACWLAGWAVRRWTAGPSPPP